MSKMARKTEARKRSPGRFGKGGRRLAGILGAVFLAIALATGSTFAWFMATDTAVNPFRNKPVGNVVITEVFVEPKKWIPGQEIKKEVGVQNLSKYDVLVRIGFEELLNKYGDVIQASGSPWSGTQVPVELVDNPVNPKYSSANGWLPPSSLGLAVDPAVVTALQGAALLAREMEITAAAPAGGSPSTGYQFVLWYDIAGGDYAGTRQMAAADLYLEMVYDAGLDLDVPTIRIADASPGVPGTAKFYYYPARVTTDATWADLMEPQLPALLSPASPQAFAAPAAADAGRSALDAAILFGFGQVTTVPTPNNWFYNEDDGYFYYIGKLSPDATSPLLLKSVTLSAAADNSHEDLRYSLLVNSEAIQNYETAMTSLNGWKMNASSPNTVAIIAALVAANALAVP